jgi:hypothetical protein
MRDRDSLLILEAYKNILNESIEEILFESNWYLYHFTYLDKALKIIESGRFVLNFAETVQSETDINRNKSFFLSTSRLPQGGYNHSMVDTFFNCIFQLDGRHISHRYKIIPVSYWYVPKQKQQTFVGKGRQYDENEDRIVSNNNNTLPVDGNVIALHVYIPKNLKIDSERNELAWDKLEKLNKQNKIKIYFYNDINAFARLDMRKSFDKLPPKPEQVDGFQRFGEYIGSSNSLNNTIKQANDILDWIENPTSEKNLSNFWHNHYSYFDFPSAALTNTFGHLKDKKDSLEAQNVLLRASRLIRKRKMNLLNLIKDAQEKSRKKFT